MALVGWSLQIILDDPVSGLIIVEKFALPSVRKAVPEKAEHIRDDHSQKSHLDDVHDSQNGAIVCNLVITMLVAVTALEKVKHLLLGNEARCTKS